MEEQHNRVVQCLGACLEPQSQRAAENQLNIEEQHPGYGLTLARISLSPAVTPPLKQLAAVILKSFIKRHWVDGDRGFQPPEVGNDEKQDIRNLLPHGLGDPDSRIRTAVGMAIAAIASWDWPQSWPGLMEHLIAAIKACSNPTLVAGCLRCLSLMGTDLDEEQKPALMQALAPELHAIMVNTAPAAAAPDAQELVSLRASAISIMTELVAGLGALQGTHQRQVRDMMTPLSQPWVEVISQVLSMPITLQHRAQWSCQLEALKLMQQLVTYFSKTLAGALTPVFSHVWNLLLGAQGLYQQVVVAGEEPEGPAAAAAAGAGGSTGEEEQVELHELMTQVFELLLCAVERPQYFRALEPALGQLTRVCITYMQMTADQEESWAGYAELCVEDLEPVSCRASAELLLEELAREWGSTANSALLQAAAAAIATARSAGGSSSWKLREAALQALGTSAENILEEVERGEPQQAQLQQQLSSLVDDLIQSDLQQLLQPVSNGSSSHGGAGGGSGGGAGDDPGYLQGRALWLAGKLVLVATPEQKERLLQVAVQGLVLPVSPLIKSSACRMIAALMPMLPPEAGGSVITPLIGPGGAVLQLLGSPDCHSDVASLLLELLNTLLEHGGEAAAEAAMAAGMQLVGPVLQVWEKNLGDPIVCEDCMAVLRSLVSIPGCLTALAQHLITPLAATLNRAVAEAQAAKQGPPAAAAAGSGGGAAAGAAAGKLPAMLAESSVDMLGVLLQPGQAGVAAAVAQAALGPSLALVTLSDDDTLVESAAMLVIKLLRVGGPDLLSWGPPGTPPDLVLQQLLSTAHHLLSLSLPDNLSRSAGPFCCQLLKSLPAAVPNFLPGLVSAAVAKVASPGVSPATIAGLLLMFSMLALADAGQMLELLGSINITGQGGVDALLPIWLRHATDVSGQLPTKHCAGALVTLLRHRSHPALSGLLVPSDELEDSAGSNGGARQTRAQTRSQGGLKYKQVPVALRILTVLGQLAAAEQEGRGKAWEGGSDQDADDDSSFCDEEDEAGVGPNGGQGVSGFVLQGRASNMNSPAPSGGGVDANGQRVLVPGEDLLDYLDCSTVNGTPLVPDDEADAMDPLAGMKLVEVIRQGLAGVAVEDGSFLPAAVGQLPHREATALRGLFPQ